MWIMDVDIMTALSSIFHWARCAMTNIFFLRAKGIMSFLRTGSLVTEAFGYFRNIESIVPKTHF